MSAASVTEPALAMTGSERRGDLRPFLVWLALFYGVWLSLVFFRDQWGTLAEHWPIALAMAFGSYFAGSTPLGGGTVGFPVLVLLFNEPATLGRDFSFAIQSIGMVSASIYILCRRQPLEWAMLRAAMVGSLVGTPLGVWLVAPRVDELTIKVVFAVIWASFGLMHFIKLREIVSQHGITRMSRAFDTRMGLVVGFGAGATVASITGVGIDLLIYAVLVLVSRADLRIAVPTSVVLMAWTSLVGIASRGLQGGIEPGVYENWLGAAPVVALGAPLGAIIVARMGRSGTLLIVSVLCVGQFAWTCQNQWDRMGWLGLGAALGGVLALSAVFHALHAWGARLARTHAHADSV
ncbi:MAG: sulfite exporter TauE/SafE family protein [Phycisphaerales bacterium]